jgi:ubiquinone/menaquinone biosynthesis C-methylase UbiE
VADADTYDSYLVPAIFEPWSRELIKRAQVWKGDRVLDVATGTGVVACRIAGTGAKVTGLDVDASRLALARQRASDEGVSVTWIEGSADALPIRQPSFELVTCQQGLQFISDRAAAVREMRRVIVPGGRAVIACWLPIDQQGPFAVIDDIAAKHTGKRHVHPFSFGDEVALNKLLVDAKFFAIAIEIVTRQVRLPDPARFATMALTTISGEPVESLTAAIADGVDALAPFVVDDGVLQFPMKSLLAVARVKT